VRRAGRASALSSVLIGVSATDPVTLGGVSLLLGVVAGLARYIRHAGRHGLIRQLHLRKQ
jgi:hypothetical protein